MECKNRASSEGNFNNWKSSFKHFENYTTGRCLFKDVNEKFCEGFKEYLANTFTLNSSAKKLSANSQHIYFNKFKAAVNTAFGEGLLAKNFVSRIQSPKAESPFREFLTTEELSTLKNAHCDNALLKRAGLFSALTGLRFGDVQNLKWKNLHHSNEHGYYLRFKSEKPQEQEMHCER